MSELSKSSLNAGFNDEIQYRLLAALIPVIEKGLHQAWGDDWFAKLNNRRTTPVQREGGRESKGLDPIRNENGQPKWDTNTVLHTIREYGRDIPSFDKRYSGSLRTWCWELLNLRNDKSHFDQKTYHTANTDRKLAYQATLAINLLKAFSERKAAEDIEKLMDGPWFSMRGGTVEQHVKSDGKSKEKGSALSTSPDALLGKAPVQELALKKSRRRTPLPPPGAGVVVFPVAGQEGATTEEDCLASASGSVLGQAVDRHFAIANTLSGNEDIFYQVIRDVRHSEPTDAKLSLKTRVRFDSEFFGGSFGLAAAIADRSARYGFAKGWDSKRIVATGVILPRRGGEIGEIDALAEKIVIVERFIPAGSLFIVPKANVEGDSKALVPKLDALRTRGIDWRAVSHIDDLNDLLASDELQAAVPTSTPTLVHAEPAPTCDNRALPPQKSSNLLPSTKHLRGAGMLAAAAMTVVAGFGGLYGFATWREERAQDIAKLQASDERLQKLASSAGVLAGHSPTAAQCIDLVRASLAVSAFDVSRLDGPHRQALDNAKSCQLQLSESDSRIASLKAAASEARDNAPAHIVALSEARAKLQSFDLDRQDQKEIADAVASGGQAVDAVRASDNRLGAFDNAITDWEADREDGAKAGRAADALAALQSFDLKRPGSLAAAKAALGTDLKTEISSSDGRISRAVVFASTMTPNVGDEADGRLDALNAFDEGRLTGPQKTIIERARSIPRQRRWTEFDAAATIYRENPDAKAGLTLATAYQALTSADRVALAPQLSKYRDVIDAVQTATLQSDIRLDDLSNTYQAVLAGERANQALAPLYDSLSKAAGTLTDFDKQRMSFDQDQAMEKARDVAIQVAASDKRLREAETWSEIALKSRNDGAVPRTVMDNVRRARSALTTFDKDRMTADVKRTLEKVCGVPVETKRGVLPALAGYDCYEPGDFKPKMLPAIR